MFRIQTLTGVTINVSEHANISLPQRRGSAFEAAERDRIMARERMRRLRQKRKDEALLVSSLRQIAPATTRPATSPAAGSSPASSPTSPTSPRHGPARRPRPGSTWKTYFSEREVEKLLCLGDRGLEWGRIAILLDGLKTGEEVRRKYEEIRRYSRV